MTDMIDNSRKETWPWTRYLARKADYYVFMATYYILIFLIMYVVNRDFLFNFLSRLSSMSEMGFIDLLKIYSILLFLFLLSLTLYSFTDSLICNKFGRNLGHKIFGLKILSQTDQNLTYNDYLKRSFFVSVTLLVLAVPLLGFIAAIIAYINYKKTGSTYWDRLSGLSVSSANASNIRTILCLSLGVNFYLLFIFSVYKMTTNPFYTSHTISEISPEQKAFIDSANRALPHRINELVVADRVGFRNGNVIIHYTIEKEDRSPLTEKDNIHIGVMKLSSPKTAIDYLCSPKGKDIFTVGKKVVYSYTLQNKVLFEYNVTPEMCPE